MQNISGPCIPGLGLGAFSQTTALRLGISARNGLASTRVTSALPSVLSGEVSRIFAHARHVAPHLRRLR